MAIKNARALTSYETRLYFVPDTRAQDQKRSQISSVNGQINKITSQIAKVNSQIGKIDNREKGTGSLQFKGSSLLIVDLVRIGILAITYPVIKSHAPFPIDAHMCETLYVILIIIEAILVGKFRRRKGFPWLVLLWAWLSVSFLLSLAGSPETGNTKNYFYLFSIVMHIYPLYVGIRLLWIANRKRKKNLEETQQKNEELKALQRELQRKKEELRKVQQKEIRQTPTPTDQEFDAWLEKRVQDAVDGTFRKAGLEVNYRQLLRVRGYVLPGMKDARHYDSQDLRYKLGADGKRRYSVNLYTYFYPAENQIMVFTYAINAMNWHDYRETMSEYFYQDVISVKTEDDYDDTLEIEGKRYRMQRFSLSFRDGKTISATVRSRPIDNAANLPVFDIPQSDLDNTIAQLRLWIRTKKG